MLLLSQISKTYQHTTALKAVDLQLLKGEMMAVVGASGCGKSTLLKIAGGLLAPSTGEVTVNGQALNGLSASALTLFRRNAIGFIFQDFNLMPVLSALENIQFGLELKGIPRKIAKQTAHEWLQIVDLAHQASLRPAQLSGGQQQRIAIARALAMKPTLILADEPTSSLDGENAEMVMNLLKTLQKQTQVSILVATHDTRMLPYMDKVIKLDN